MTVMCAEKSQHCQKYFLQRSSLHLPPKDLRFENWGAKLGSCPGCHLSSLCPAGVAKSLEPRAAFATAWPLEGRVQ